MPMPLDDMDNVMPALAFKADGAHKITSTGAAVKNAAAFDERTSIVSLYATAPVFISFGDATVVAINADHYFPAGVYYDVAIGDGRKNHTPYISIIAEDADAIVYISEKG